MDQEQVQERVVNQNQITDRAVKKICGNSVWMSMVAIFFFGLAALIVYGLITEIQGNGFELQLTYNIISASLAFIFIVLGLLLVAITTKMSKYKATKESSDLESALSNLTFFWIVFGLFGIIATAGISYLVFGGLA